MIVEKDTESRKSQEDSWPDSTFRDIKQRTDVNVKYDAKDGAAPH